MRKLILAMMLWPAVVCAQEPWIPLSGAQITDALTDRELLYDDGARQTFRPGGDTHYGDTSGSWRVQGDQYCSIWPPSERWACYDVEASGNAIRFVDAAGKATQARYDDVE